MLLASCQYVQKHQTVVLSSEVALEAIKNERLISIEDVDDATQNDTIFSLVSIEEEDIGKPFYFLMRRKVDFYVFQNEVLIYENQKDSFYQGVDLQTKSYFYYADENKQLHQITLRNTEPLYFLIKHHSKRKTKDLISFSKPEEKWRETLLAHKIPTVEVNTLKNALNDKTYQNVQFRIRSNKKELNFSSKMKIRGASSKSFPKKQFSIKSNNDVSFEGIQLGKSVLYAPYVDRSLIRNKLSYDLYSEMSGRVNPSEYCNVLVNGNYEGIYLLLEHPQQQFKSTPYLLKNSSSFLVQIDRCPCDMIHENYEEGYHKSAYSIEYPKKANAAFRNEIDQRLLHFESALIEGDLSAIHKESFADFIILNELSKNIDAYRLSTFLAFDGLKMHAGPVWDYNIAWGLAEHAQGYEPEGFVIDGVHKKNAAYWWQALWQNEELQLTLKQRYKLLRKTMLSEEQINKRINTLMENLGENIRLNTYKWDLYGKNVWPNKYNSESYEKEIERMKLWIGDRLKWLDKQWYDLK